MNTRWPAPTPTAAWLMPSSDVVLGLALVVLFAPASNWSPRKLSRIAAAGLICVRLSLVAEGICERYLNRHFHLVADASLIPEFMRLARSTLGTSPFVLALFAFVAALVGLFWLLQGALRVLASTLVQRRNGDVYLVCVATCTVLGALFVPSGSVFAHSVAPRALDELERWLEARGLFDDPAHAAQRKQFEARFEHGQKRLLAARAALAHAATPDVHVILVEAYGRTTQSSAFYRERLAPAQATFAENVRRAGFSVCTGFVRATVFGGNSWLTHATIESATGIADQFEYALLMEQKGMVTLAGVLGGAGYRTLSVKPGTTRPAPHTRIYGFSREYIAPDFDYRGPTYAWSPMPDQFVLQRIADLELTHPSTPLFVEYALVTSHFPWTPQPRWVDGSSLGDGSLFRQQAPLRYERAQGEASAQMLGYADSIAYDLRATSEFIARHVRGEALVFVLGDHQPIGPVAGLDTSRDTPMHVLSRRPEWLAAFAAHGCRQGVLGNPDETMYGMEDLGPEILTALSQLPARELDR